MEPEFSVAEAEALALAQKTIAINLAKIKEHMDRMRTMMKNIHHDLPAMRSQPERHIVDSVTPSESSQVAGISLTTDLVIEKSSVTADDCQDDVDEDSSSEELEFVSASTKPNSIFEDGLKSVSVVDVEVGLYLDIGFVLSKPTDVVTVHAGLFSMLQMKVGKDDDVSSGMDSSVCAPKDSQNFCSPPVRQNAQEIIILSLSTGKPPPLPPDIILEDDQLIEAVWAFKTLISGTSKENYAIIVVGSDVGLALLSPYHDLSNFFEGLKIPVWVNSVSFHSYAEIEYETMSDGERNYAGTIVANGGIYVGSLDGPLYSFLPTGAALQYGIDKYFSNKSRHDIFYDMGARSTHAALVCFSSYKTKEFRKTVSTNQLQVKDVSCNSDHGGQQMQGRLVEYFADEFNKQLGKGVDVRKSSKAMVKLKKQVKKTKEILSAYMIAPLSLESIYNDHEFMGTIIREKFEELCKDIWEKSLVLIKEVVERSQIIRVPSFTLMVLLTIMVTGIATPLISIVYDPTKPYMNIKRRTILHTPPNTRLQAVACIHDQESVSGIIKLMEVYIPTQSSPFVVCALHFVELVGRASPVFIDHSAEDGCANFLDNNPIPHALKLYEDARRGLVKIHPFTVVSQQRSMYQHICELSLNTKATLIILQFLKECLNAHGGGKQWRHGVQTLDTNALANSPCSVGILVDEGPLQNPFRVAAADVIVAAAARQGHACRQSTHNFVLLFLGGADAREALSFADRMAGNPGVPHTVVCFLSYNYMDDFISTLLSWMSHNDNIPLCSLETNMSDEESDNETGGSRCDSFSSMKMLFGYKRWAISTILALEKSFSEAQMMFLSHRTITFVFADCFHGLLLSACIMFIFLGAASQRDYFRHLRDLRGHDGEDFGAAQGSMGAGQIVRNVHVEQMINGLDDADSAKDPFDELVGIPGPILHLVESASTAWATVTQSGQILKDKIAWLEATDCMSYSKYQMVESIIVVEPKGSDEDMEKGWEHKLQDGLTKKLKSIEAPMSVLITKQVNQVQIWKQKGKSEDDARRLQQEIQIIKPQLALINGWNYKHLFFSSPRPPDDLEDNVVFKGRGMLHDQIRITLGS